MVTNYNNNTINVQYIKHDCYWHMVISLQIYLMFWKLLQFFKTDSKESSIFSMNWIRGIEETTPLNELLNLWSRKVSIFWSLCSSHWTNTFLKKCPGHYKLWFYIKIYLYVLRNYLCMLNLASFYQLTKNSRFYCID